MLPRLKLQLAGNGKELTAAFVALGVVLLLGAGYVYMTPPIEQPDPQPDAQPDPGPETEEFEAFFLEVELIDSAEVQDGSGRYEEGQVLTKWPAYFYQYSPELEFNISVNTTRNVTVDLQQVNLTREERIVADRNDETLYENNRLLIYRAPEISNGRFSTRRTFNVRNELQEPAEDIAADFPSSTSSLNTRLLLTVEYVTEPINGQRYNGTIRLTPELGSNNDAYWIEGEQTARISENQTRIIEPAEPTEPTQPTEPPEPVRGEPDMQLVGMLSLLGLVCIGVGGVVAAKVPEIDPEELKKEVEHNEYSEWISEGELMLDSANEYVYVSSIEDLVNVGIDTDKRVIYDPDLSVYTVTDGDVIYYYTTEPSDLQRWAHI
ncbi:hypothetical protein EGH24_01780 [Halonotius terrestris]|uniref:DUF5305 domain-containing protein n=1 Tax=Halonotius terrestris TaxID=2487750 RepID=A0A8J8TDQ7_9EURY|nr:DUF5305 family protein [Halonotius terrestris]TQQ83547.1 hypothetical protein EGH24_01780 [Halonotius terrestris]